MGNDGTRQLTRSDSFSLGGEIRIESFSEIVDHEPGVREPLPLVLPCSFSGS